MKLATFHDGTRDGALAVVSRDLTQGGQRRSRGCRPAHAAAAAGRLAVYAFEGRADLCGAERSGRRAPARALRDGRLRRGSLRCTIAARLSVGRRIGLREPRRAGAPRARGRDARELLDRAADVPGRIGHVPRRPRRDCAGGRGVGHRSGRRGGRHHRRRAHGGVSRGGGRAHLPPHAGQRRIAAQSHSGGAGQGLRLLPRQAVDGLLARGGHARRARAGLGGRQGAPAAAGIHQRCAAGPAQCGPST